jgi:hypothetical protein
LGRWIYVCGFINAYRISIIGTTALLTIPT